MKVYQAKRDEAGCTVTVNGAPLDPRLDLRRYSENGFEWGYEGSGPRQLALAILADFHGSDQTALDRHQSFMEAVIAVLKGDEWSLTDDQIDNTVSQIVDVPMDLKTLLDKVRGKI